MKRPSISARPKTTRLSCSAPTAKAVFVAGTFNDWSPTATALKRGPKGVWSVDLKLTPGRHEFKFVVDGAWCCEIGCEPSDAAHSQCVLNPFGTMNRVIEVAGS